MSKKIDNELLDYYRHYCELTIWLKKIILRSVPNHIITIQDIAKEFIDERNRILKFVPAERRRSLRTSLNKIATSYYFKITNWSTKQKITTDMV